MTPEEQRIAIAEACGWTFDTQGVPTSPDGTRWGILNLRAVPNYPADLNACYEMEKVLTEEQCDTYGHTLISCEVLVRDDEDNPNSEMILMSLFDAYGWYGLLKATAAQRSEAFLKTIGKWNL